MAIASDEGFRMPAIETAEVQHGHGAPTYMYLFSWESPALGGVLGASHALEIPFVFDNVHQPGVAILTGDGDDRGPLASAMNAAWTSFARDGVPEAVALPAWPQYETTDRSTMVFDRTCRVEHDPLGADRRAWKDRLRHRLRECQVTIGVGTVTRTSAQPRIGSRRSDPSAPDLPFGSRSRAGAGPPDRGGLAGVCSGSAEPSDLRPSAHAAVDDLSGGNGAGNGGAGPERDAPRDDGSRRQGR